MKRKEYVIPQCDTIVLQLETFMVISGQSSSYDGSRRTDITVIEGDNEATAKRWQYHGWNEE
ncbi:MAG: hypothetical protein I3J02_00530 [Prevotella sp.]|nr:hypothetical protein [Prevotella sp.]